MANMLAMAGLVEPGDEVVVEHPTYELLLDALGYLQADVRRFSRRAETGFALEPAEIERAISPRTRLIVITNLHNPSSAFTDEDTLRAVGEIARRAGARVLVDEVYLDAVFPLAPRSAALLGPEFVVTSSLTKVYGLSGLRCGWILAEPQLARRIWLLDDLFDVNMAHPAERLSLAVLRNFERVRGQARALLETNRVLLNQFLSGRKDLNVRQLQFGTTVFPKLLSGPVDRFCELFREKYEGTVVPGSFFGMADHFRIGIGGETEPLRNSRTIGCCIGCVWRLTSRSVEDAGILWGSQSWLQPAFSRLTLQTSRLKGGCRQNCLPHKQLWWASRPMVTPLRRAVRKDGAFNAGCGPSRLWPKLDLLERRHGRIAGKRGQQRAVGPA